MIFLVVALAGCGDDLTLLPPAALFRDLIPEVRLGLTVVQLEAARPYMELWTDGSHRESLREGTVQYHFSPRAAGQPPPPWARLRAVEHRARAKDSITLRSAWWDQVEAMRGRLGLRPRCLRLGGGGGVIHRAEFAGAVVISLSAEVWREPDGQGHEAHLVTRVGEGELEYTDEAGLASVRVDCVHPTTILN